MGYVLYGDGWGIPNQTKVMINHGAEANWTMQGKKEQCWNKGQNKIKYI